MRSLSSEGAAELNPLRPRPERSSEAYTDSITQIGPKSTQKTYVP